MVLLVSCGGDRVVFTKYEIIDENTGWAKDKPLTFSVSILDTTQLYDVYIHIRNADNYAYRNLFLFLHTKYPDKTTSTDTLECILADEKGRWLGGGLGDLHDHTILFKKNTHFRQAGFYLISFEQAMRAGEKNTIDPLPLITEMGLSVEKAR